MGQKSSTSSKSKKKSSHLSSKRKTPSVHQRPSSSNGTSNRTSPVQIPGAERGSYLDSGQLRHFSPVDISLIGRTPPDHDFTLSGFRVNGQGASSSISHVHSIETDSHEDKTRRRHLDDQQDRRRVNNDLERDSDNIDGSSEDSQSSEEDEDETQAQKDEVQLVRVVAEAEQEESSNTIEDIDNAEQHLLSQLRALHSKLEGLRGRKGSVSVSARPLSRTLSDPFDEVQNQSELPQTAVSGLASKDTSPVAIRSPTVSVTSIPSVSSVSSAASLTTNSMTTAPITTTATVIATPTAITSPTSPTSSTSVQISTPSLSTTITANNTLSNNSSPVPSSGKPNASSIIYTTSNTTNTTNTTTNTATNTTTNTANSTPPAPASNNTANNTSFSAFASSLSPTSKLIVCAVNKPVRVSVSDDGYGFQYAQNCDAFTVAIETLRGAGTRVEWVFAPTIDAPRQKLKAAMTQRLREDYACHPLYLDSNIKGAYGDMCTRLFSVFHGIHLEGHLTQSQIATDAVEEEQRGLDAYRVINEHFAQEISEMYVEGDLVLVCNYQLLLVPQMLRRRCPNVTCGFFFDCPFPPTEFFRTIPVRSALLSGVLESDLVLFHHFDHVMNFNTTCTLLLGVDATAQHVHTTNGRLVSVMVCPLGVDPMRHDAGHPSVVVSSATLRDRLKEYRIVAAVDTLDTIKGLPQKILAFEEFLVSQRKLEDNSSNSNNQSELSEKSDHARGGGRIRSQQVIFVLVLAPAHETGNFYEHSTTKRDVLVRLAKQVNGLVGRVNGRYGTADYTPIHYIRYGLSKVDTVALLSMTDVYLATSLSEGVTMSALEFVAAQSKEGEIQSRRVVPLVLDQSMNSMLQQQQRQQSGANNNMGVLLYSEFAGCARSLKGALIVNPYDVVAVGNSIREALSMGAKQKAIRWLQLSQYVQTYTALNWAERMIRYLALSSVTSAEFGSGKPLEQDALFQDYRHAKKRVFIFSYGGVLTDPATLPSLSRPSQEAVDMLSRLSRDPKNSVVVVDTSSRITLDRWFRKKLEGQRVLLVAENGYCCSWLGEKEEEIDTTAGSGSEVGGTIETKEEQHLKEMGIDSKVMEVKPSSDCVVKDAIQEIVASVVSSAGSKMKGATSGKEGKDETDEKDEKGKEGTEGKQELSKHVSLSSNSSVPDAVNALQRIDHTWRLCGVTDTITNWRGEISAVLEHFKLRTPGSFVDVTCDSCMIWYYTNADPDFGFRQAKDLHQHLDRMLRAWPLEAVFLRPRKCIVIRPMSSNTQRLAEIALRVSSSNADYLEQAALDVKIRDERIRDGVGAFAGGSRIIAEALQDPNCLVMCSCCDAISQRMLIPLTGKRVQSIERLSRLYTLSVGIKISRAKYYVEDHLSLLSSMVDLLDKTS